ncbi:MAG: YciI family protein [Acidobacteria bacterium]|nr:YciI family protein [Acidobacteriota bacterium]
MRYMLLIYDAEAARAKATPEEQKATFEAWMAYSAELNEKGVKLAGEALMPTSMAKTARIRDGKTLATDGPFAETKEQLGGFYILNCKDLDEAVAWAAKAPNAPFGSVEVRPVMEFGD